MRRLGIGTFGVMLVAFAPAPLAGQLSQIAGAMTQDPLAGELAAMVPSALAGNVRAQLDITYAYLAGHKVTVEPPQMMEWMHKAADGGRVSAQELYGLLLYRDNRPAEAAPYFEKAAQQRMPNSQFVYAVMLWTGKGVPQDKLRARSLMAQAAQTLPRAREALAKMGGAPAEPAHPLAPMDQAAKQRWRDQAARYAHKPIPTAPTTSGRKGTRR